MIVSTTSEFRKAYLHSSRNWTAERKLRQMKKRQRKMRLIMHECKREFVTFC